jgi:mannose/fructose/N-acetylgalactosamine-specific phosphotransferase system component IIC
MELDLVQYLPLALLGAVLGLDTVSFPQAMLARPLVSATAAGALLGEPTQGLLVGVALEFFALETLPFGASRYPEWGGAGVVGGALFAMSPDGAAASMTVAVLAALVTAGLGGISMVLLRRWNARWAKRQQLGLARGSGLTVTGLQLAGMTADLVRGGVLTLGALVIFDTLRLAILSTVVISPTLSRAVVVSVASAVGLAAIFKVVRTTPGARWWLLGGVIFGFVIAAGLLFT